MKPQLTRVLLQIVIWICITNIVPVAVLYHAVGWVILLVPIIGITTGLFLVALVGLLIKFTDYTTKEVSKLDDKLTKVTEGN